MSFEWWEHWWNKSIIKKTTQSLQKIGDNLIDTIKNKISTHDKDNTIPKVIERHYDKITDTIGRHYDNWKTFIQELLGTLLNIKDDVRPRLSNEGLSHYKWFYHKGNFISGTLDNLIDQITEENIQSITDTTLLEELLKKASEMKENSSKYINQNINKYKLWDEWIKSFEKKENIINHQIEFLQNEKDSTHRANEETYNSIPIGVGVETDNKKRTADPSLN